MQVFETTARVMTKAGPVTGLLGRDDGIARFKGIPFAAPPTGERRWCKPLPPQPWSRPLAADRYAAAPLQPLLARHALMGQFSFADPPECGLGEDCLTLNVWTPSHGDRRARLPVIVWIFGGGMRVGSASHPVSDGTALAELGAVVVSLNYRLSGLGFLAHPALSREAGVSGNYAAHDILAGLRWVQQNIGAFGGDPDCVTLFGQSAGAALLSVLMASPLSKGLFHRAIAHSGGRFGPMKGRDAAEREGDAFMKGLGADDLQALRDLPGDAMYGEKGQWGPIVDGELLAAPVSEVFAAGRQMAIPLLCGYTRDEAAGYGVAAHQTPEGFRAHVRASHPAHAEALLALYPSADATQARAASFALRRDSTFALQAWRMASAHSAVAACYAFSFSRRVPLHAGARWLETPPDGGFGAYHGAELWYAFDTLRHLQADQAASDAALAKTMSRAWVEFARSGRPSADGLPSWPVFSPDRPQVVDFDETVTVGPPFNIDAFRILGPRGPGVARPL